MTLSPVATSHPHRAIQDQTNSGEAEMRGFAKTAFIALTSMTAASGLLGCPVTGRSEFSTAAPLLRVADEPSWPPWATLWEAAATDPGTPAAVNEVQAPDTSEVRSDQEEIRWVKENSGLTWDQLGKVFGVSRRAVHLWANGGRMNEANAGVLRRFAAEVASHQAGTPEQTRSALLAHDVVDAFRRAQVRSAGGSIGSAFAPEEKVENLRDPEVDEMVDT
jgi:transcriptional regulator with XRE-family HTH domain